METATTVTEKGQVTIPIRYRDLLGITAGKKIKFSYKSKTKELRLALLGGITSLRGILKSKKKYDKKRAREAIVKDLLAGRV